MSTSAADWPDNLDRGAHTRTAANGAARSWATALLVALLYRRDLEEQARKEGQRGWSTSGR